MNLNINKKLYIIVYRSEIIGKLASVLIYQSSNKRKSQSIDLNDCVVI